MLVHNRFTVETSRSFYFQSCTSQGEGIRSNISSWPHALDRRTRSHKKTEFASHGILVKNCWNYMVDRRLLAKSKFILFRASEPCTLFGEHGPWDKPLFTDTCRCQNINFKSSIIPNAASSIWTGKQTKLFRYALSETVFVASIGGLSQMNSCSSHVVAKIFKIVICSTFFVDTMIEQEYLHAYIAK